MSIDKTIAAGVQQSVLSGLFSMRTCLALCSSLLGCLGGEEHMQKEPFDAELGAQLAGLSNAAYQMKSRGDRWSGPKGYELIARYSVTESASIGTVPMAFLAIRDGQAYVAFRGTSTDYEWMRNIEFTFSDFPGIGGDGVKTHSGFSRLFEEMRSSLLADLGRELTARSITQVNVTGHSLGAALATLAAPTIASAYAAVSVRLYTFASPRVGDGDFVERFAELVPTSWRVANPADLVTQLPIEIMYQHVDSQQKVEFEGASGIEENHDRCRYLSQMCKQVKDPAACKKWSRSVGC